MFLIDEINKSFDKFIEFIKLAKLLDEHPIGSIKVLKFFCIFCITIIVGFVNLSFFHEFKRGFESELFLFLCNIVFIILLLIMLRLLLNFFIFLIKSDLKFHTKSGLNIPSPTNEVYTFEDDLIR